MDLNNVNKLYIFYGEIIIQLSVEDYAKDSGPGDV